MDICSYHSSNYNFEQLLRPSKTMSRSQSGTMKSANGQMHPPLASFSTTPNHLHLAKIASSNSELVGADGKAKEITHPTTVRDPIAS